MDERLGRYIRLIHFQRLRSYGRRCPVCSGELIYVLDSQTQRRKRLCSYCGTLFRR